LIKHDSKKTNTNKKSIHQLNSIIKYPFDQQVNHWHIVFFAQ